MNHIVPRDDLIEHITDDTECPCDPTVEIENELVIHNAMDRREIFE